MTQATSAQNVANTSRKNVDRPRPGVGRLLIRVQNRNTGQALPDGGQVDGNFAPLGESQHVIYEDQLPYVMGLVEDMDLIEQAQKHYERKLAKWLDLGKQNGDEVDEKYTEDTCPNSLEASFRELHDRDIRPFDRVEVVQKLPPLAPALQSPEDSAAAQIQQYMPLLKQLFAELRQESASSGKDAAKDAIAEILAAEETPKKKG